MVKYFQEQKSLKGYVNMVQEILKMMMENASVEEVNDFLYELGQRLAKHNPINANDSLSDFHIKLNEKLAMLGFGVAQIEDLNTALQITHRQIEECTDQSFADSWQRAFAVVLCGLYQGYFAQAGAPSALVCKVVSIVAPNEVVLQLKKRG